MRNSTSRCSRLARSLSIDHDTISPMRVIYHVFDFLTRPAVPVFTTHFTWPKFSVLKSLDALLAGTAILVSHVDMCRVEEWGCVGFPVWTCPECFRLLVPASWRRVDDPDFRCQGCCSRVRSLPCLLPPMVVRMRVRRFGETG